MNFALSDEQEFLREAARGALSRHKTLEAAREALENPEALPDLWPTAVEAGWPGLLIGEEQGGAGLGVFDAMLVAEECGRVLAPVPLLGLVVPAGFIAVKNCSRKRASTQSLLLFTHWFRMTVSHRKPSIQSFRSAPSTMPQTR